MTSLPWQLVQVHILLKLGLNSAGSLVAFVNETCNFVMTALDATTRSTMVIARLGILM